MRAFLCHSSKDSKFVIEAAKHLKRSLDGDVFYFEEHQRSDESFIDVIDKELKNCQIVIIFVGKSFTEWQKKETTAAINLKVNSKEPRHIITVLLPEAEGLPLTMLSDYQTIPAKETTPKEAYRVAKEIIVEKLEEPWLSADDLPLNPNLFSYEKDIIEHFVNKAQLERQIAATASELETEEAGTERHEQLQKQYDSLWEKYEAVQEKQLNGCPAEWPEVVYWEGPRRKNEVSEGDIGTFRPLGAKVIPAALSKYHHLGESEEGNGICMMSQNLCFPEAGPREMLLYPAPGRNLQVAVLISGGIAPGINAVIDGITQRHYMYAAAHNYQVDIWGFKNGFHAFDNLQKAQCMLTTEKHKLITDLGTVTSDHVSEGGSILGTSRVEALIDVATRGRELERIVRRLYDRDIDILYIIGGDGSMKAAHAIWSLAREYAENERPDRKLSVVAIPKTMDNDVLWVWQTFGFLSAVERARGVIENLATEAKSNPRLGVIQLFGSDSGFVVSHAVLASRTGICDAALIPEIAFSMRSLATYLKKKMCKRGERIPYGLIVMAETAIPTDAMDYVDGNSESYVDIGLSEDEKETIREFDEIRKRGEHIQGQTNDALRTAGLKIVSRGLHELLPSQDIKSGFRVEPDWQKLRVFTNEPRHLLRAIPPSCSDIIFAHRLGTLAVDNAMAGYTDFMVSQWLTEYVLIPLKLVVMGRKRIPETGIFWKSVLAKTDQDDLA
jgi:6-phosphofructokinase 1